MAESTPAAARGERAVDLDRPALARARPLRRAAADGRRGCGHRADVEPVDLPEGDRRRRRLRRPDPRAASRRPTTRARSSSRSRSRTSATPATCCARCGSGRAARTATSRSRSTPGSPSTRRRRSSRRSTSTSASSGRTSTSRSRRRVEGLPAIEDCIAARHPDQRHADLLARALRRGRRRLPARPRAASPSTAATRRRSPRSRRSSSRASTPRPTHGSRSSATRSSQGKLGIANAKLAYKHFEEAFAGPVWERLAAAGANVQRPLWASTSTKNPAYRDVMYVEELIGPDTVNTMPLETARGLRRPRRGSRRHGEGGRRGGRAARCGDLAAAGVDYDDVVAKLEAEGVQKFADCVRRADRGHRGQARRAGGDDVTTERRELVARIWSRDPTVWTGKDEARWLGWLGVSIAPASFADGLRRTPFALSALISADGCGSITTTRLGSRPCASQPVSIAPPIFPAPASAMVPSTFFMALVLEDVTDEYSLVVPAKAGTHSHQRF